jgi:hypothetical protein
MALSPTARSEASGTAGGLMGVYPLDVELRGDKVKFTGLTQNLQVDPAV